MENKEYLNEERYQANKKRLARVAIVILVVGLIIGGTIIGIGVTKMIGTNSKYSDGSKNSVLDKLNNEKKSLEKRKVELEAKGVRYKKYAKYTDGDEYELMLIVNVLDPSFSYYKFKEYKNNPITSKYCELKAEIDEFNDGFSKDSDSFKTIPFFMLGAFVIIASCIVGGSVYMTSKGREIAAFKVQQGMPIAQEGIEKVTPTVTKSGKTIMKEMAPMYGEIAKEIAKGVKDGMNNEDK